jgi:hypothetical protein
LKRLNISLLTSTPYLQEGFFMRKAFFLSVIAAALFIVSNSFSASHTTGTLSGVKVNGGTVTHITEGGKQRLMWSDDFKIPDPPAPHWQVVDSTGNVYLLQRLSMTINRIGRSRCRRTFLMSLKCKSGVPSLKLS